MMRKYHVRFGERERRVLIETRPSLLNAEMGASFLSAEVGINYSEIVENNAAYLQGWLNKLKEDKRFIFRAAAKAQQATKYILGKAG